LLLPASSSDGGVSVTVTREERKLGRRQPLSVSGKYLSLTTYRRDGTPVSTPVWFVEEDGRLFVTTTADSYKAKRLRRNPAAMVAPCTARGLPQQAATVTGADDGHAPSS
jgi:general stress protein 26